MRTITRVCRSLLMALALFAGAQFLLAGKVWAVPSFARQTGLACEACHTVFPELTFYGRLFKLNGYVWENVKSVSDINPQRATTLSLSEIPPISVMLQVTETHINKSLPDLNLPTGVSQNDTVEFPQAASFFYAGKIAPNLGTFFQVTFSPTSNSIGIDNTDIRFADSGQYWDRNWIYGLSLNNNPTSQDVWNSTPAFGFPFITFNAAPKPAAAAIVDGGLAQQAAGATAYLFMDKHYYVEAGAYRSAKVGFTNKTLSAPGPLDSTASNVIDGVAPYWRLAYEQDWGKNTFEIGHYGLFTDIKPGGSAAAPVSITSGPSDEFTDLALDTQYQYIGEDNLFSLAGTWIHQSADRRATNPGVTDDLDTLRATATYFYQRKYGGSLELFQTTGTRDNVVFFPTPVTGSRNGLPDTRGVTLELDYVPWLNTKIGAQYTAYAKFNGATSNYDGSGRNASDNNTFFLFLWTSF